MDYQWKMSFDPGTTKQFQEEFLGRKLRETSHRTILFNNTAVCETSS